MAEFKTRNNVKVVIHPAPFGDAMALKNAIFSQIKLAKLDLGALKVQDVGKIASLDATPFIESLLAMDADPKVNEALMKCLVRCTYNSIKITENTFEDEKAREDYYDIVIECIKANLAPFLKGLISRLNALPNVPKNGSPQLT